MTSITYTTITNLQDDLLAPWLDLYETAFPPEGRVFVSTFIKFLREREHGGELPAEMLAVVEPDHRLAGMAFYQMQPRHHVAELWYVAIDPRTRSQGLGSQVYREIIRRIEAAGCQAMLFEVEIPENAHTPEIKSLAERRIQFYRRNGARLLSGIAYLQSVGPHQPVTPMHLMIHPLRPYDPQEAFELAELVYPDSVKQTGRLELS